MLGSWTQKRERLFRDERDCQRFLQRLGEGVEDFRVRLYLFTLMSNHYHLVLETPEGNLSRFMQSLSKAYTVYYNRRHRLNPRVSVLTVNDGDISEVNDGMRG